MSQLKKTNNLKPLVIPSIPQGSSNSKNNIKQPLQVKTGNTVIKGTVQQLPTKKALTEKVINTPIPPKTNTQNIIKKQVQNINPNEETLTYSSIINDNNKTNTNDTTGVNGKVKKSIKANNSNIGKALDRVNTTTQVKDPNSYLFQNSLKQENVEAWVLQKSAPEKNSTREKLMWLSLSENNQAGPKILTPTMQVKYIKIDGIGSLGSLDKTSDYSKTKFNCTLTTGIGNIKASPDKIEKLLAEQKAFVVLLHNACNKIIEKLYYDPDVQTEYKQSIRATYMATIASTLPDQAAVSKYFAIKKNMDKLEEFIKKTFTEKASIPINIQNGTNELAIYFENYVFSPPKVEFNNKRDTDNTFNNNNNNNKKDDELDEKKKVNKSWIKPDIVMTLDVARKVYDDLIEAKYTYNKFVVMRNNEEIPGDDPFIQKVLTNSMVNLLMKFKPFSQKTFGSFGVKFEMDRNMYLIMMGSKNDEIIDIQKLGIQYYGLDEEDNESSELKQNEGEINKGELNGGEPNDGESNDGELNEGKTNEELNEGETNGLNVVIDEEVVGGLDDDNMKLDNNEEETKEDIIINTIIDDNNENNSEGIQNTELVAINDENQDKDSDLENAQKPLPDFNKYKRKLTNQSEQQPKIQKKSNIKDVPSNQTELQEAMNNEEDIERMKNKKKNSSKK